MLSSSQGQLNVPARAKAVSPTPADRDATQVTAGVRHRREGLAPQPNVRGRRGIRDLVGTVAAVALGAALLTGCVNATLSSETTQPPADSTARSVVATGSSNAQPARPRAVLPKPKAPLKKPGSTAAPKKRDPRLYPDPRLTPGDTLNVTAAQVSVPGYSSRVRNVPVSEKEQTFAEYGLSYPQKPGAYECDHFIPLCLGGSNDIANLWPEPAPEFHWKDGLEVYLWRAVKAGRIGLKTAQDEMRSDWYRYWVAAGKPGWTSDTGGEAANPATRPRPSSAGIVGWSVSGARYHYLSCRYFAQIRPANRRTGTVAQAQAAGKTPCTVCRPPK